MAAAEKIGLVSFESRMRDFFEIIDIRPTKDAEDFEAIYRLRYQAYRRENFIPPNAERLCTDELDTTPNKHLFGIYIAGELVSSIRLSILSKEHPHSPSMMAFSDILNPWLDAGQVFIDPSRFVTERNVPLVYPELPLAMMKIPIMAAQYFKASYGLSTVRTEHAAFYKRVFHSKQVSDIRHFPYVDMNVVMLRTETKHPERGIFRRYPFFRSNYLEQRALFRDAGEVRDRRTKNTLVFPA